MVEGTFKVIDIVYSYVTIFCSWRALSQDLLVRIPAANLALEILADGYFIPIALVLMFLVHWFEGATVAERTANQRAVLCGSLATLFAWGLSVLVGLAWEEGLNGPGWEQVLSNWTCWQGTPFPCLAAAGGVAMGAASWRQDWRWGLRCLLVTGLWVSTQVCLGRYYPMDVIVGTLIGASLGWLLGAAARLNRLLEVLIRLARHWLLA